MNDCCLPVGLSALAGAIAGDMDTKDIALLAAVLVQLGDTLALIAVKRDVCDKS